MAVSPGTPDNKTPSSQSQSTPEGSFIITSVRQPEPEPTPTQPSETPPPPVRPPEQPKPTEMPPSQPQAQTQNPPPQPQFQEIYQQTPPQPIIETTESPQLSTLYRHSLTQADSKGYYGITEALKHQLRRGQNQ